MSLAHSFTSWGELKGASRMVMAGTATAQTNSAGKHGFRWTSTTILVDRIVASRGQQAPQEVRVRQQSSDSDVRGAFTILRLGSRYLLFLTPTTVTVDEYYPVGSYQGAFTVSAGNTVNSMSPEGLDVGVVVRGKSLDGVIEEIQAAPWLKVNP